MKLEDLLRRTFGVSAAAALLALAVIGYTGWSIWRATPGTSGYAQAQQEARDYVADWPLRARMTATLIIHRYGAPDYRTPQMLLWGRRGDWKRTIVHRTLGWDTLEQAVDYELTAVEAKRAEAVGHGLKANVAAEELVAQSDGEDLNYLALNLAHEAILGKRTPEEARAFYSKAADLAASGKASPYMQGLMFTPVAPAPHRMYGRGMVY